MVRGLFNQIILQKSVVASWDCMCDQTLFYKRKRYSTDVSCFILSCNIDYFSFFYTSNQHYTLEMQRNTLPSVFVVFHIHEFFGHRSLLTKVTTLKFVCCQSNTFYKNYIQRVNFLQSSPTYSSFN